MNSLRKKQLKKLKVAIVADDLQFWGGAQDNVVAFGKVFPNSDIYTSVYEEEFLKKHFPGKEVKATFAQKMPFEKKLRAEYYLLYPLAFKMLNLKKYDLVISVSSAFAKFVKAKKHFFYCLTPPRYLWLENRSNKHVNKFSYKIYSFFQPMLHGLWRRQDRKAARRATMISSNSKEVAKRVKKYYDLNARVLYPPVEMGYLKFNPDYASREDWFFYVGRVERYKGVDMMIRACINAKKTVKRAGTGSFVDELKEMVKNLKGEKFVEFLGYITDEEKADLLFKTKALIFPVKDEDFGIVPIEANAAGCPVLAFAGGGVLETVVDGKTGRLFREYTSEALQEELEKWDTYSFEPKVCREQSQKFSFEVFEDNMLELTDEIFATNE